ncbi:unnamed protein product [Mytilus coruscus]|uniref:AAA+ ATPase domain-containing protein n=1 Tax=Mytilus coruscus TaxID=42192 RepID=A0A6J8A0V1_MYTCO|nr:unnamed protein product [Mytilus coruscus]
MDFEDETPVLQFETPTSIMVCGPTNSGKTMFIKRLLENAQLMFKNVPSYILYCYGSVWKPICTEMQRSIDGIMFHEGIPSKEDLMEARGDDRRHMICVLDDLLHDLANDRWAQELICVSSHHLNITVCLVGHNIYEKGKVMRTLSLNMHYYILFENRRDSEQILRFGRQVFPHKGKYFLDSFIKAMSFSRYMMVDLNPKTEKLYSLRTRIFPGEDTIVFRPKNEEKTDND